MKNQVRCDLAVEAKELVTAKKGEDYEIPGVKIEDETISGYIYVTRVQVENKEGSENIGKEIGHYSSIEMPRRFYGEQSVYEEMCQVCAKELKRLTDPILTSDFDSVLVVGLGNWNITADALGPKVIKSIMVTRHLKEYIPEEIDEGIRPVSAISPGVLGLTGMETGEIIKGLVDRVRPKLVIAIDALCARRVERINTTIQITDTGITPGAGIGNKRQEIDQSSLGVPVIAIGVPTVVDAATIAGEAIQNVVEQLEAETKPKKAIGELFQKMNPEEKYALITEGISTGFGNFIVSPKEIDSIIQDLSGVIANGINIALHRGIKLADVDRYI